MLNKARAWNVIRNAPDFKLFKEEGRAFMMRDIGMRNARELFRMRDENIDWNSRVIFDPTVSGLGEEESRLARGSRVYCARHDFGTYVLQKTGNIAAVMNIMGRSDVKTAMTYRTRN